MNLVQHAKRRHTAKAYDPERKVPDAVIAELRELLRHSPSSVNSQPWHFVLAGSDAGKQRIARAAEGTYAYNAPKILNASHVFVLCTRAGVDESHLQAVLDKEDQDGRFANADARKQQHASRSVYANLHRYDLKDAQHWMEKQLYIALGYLLLGAAAMEVDATPMEGFNAKVLDEELGLRAKGYTSTVLVAVGYRGEQDFNARLPKSRLAAEQVFTEI